jgi:hypothetical protein
MRGQSPNRERVARTARAKPEPRGRSPSTPPAPTRPRPAAPTVRVHPAAPTRPRLAAPTVRVHLAAPIVRVHPASGCPNQLGHFCRGVGLEWD